MVKKRTIILYPNLGTKAGTGHIKRLLPFFCDNRFTTYLVHRDYDFVLSVAKIFNINTDMVFPLKDIRKITTPIDLIILDNRESDRYLYDKLKNIAPIVGLDEGGDARHYVPYTIDTLPNLTKTIPNCFNPGLLELPEKSKEIDKLTKILITFGGQDPFDLTTKVVEQLKDKYDITTVIGPLFKKNDYGVKKLLNVDNLKIILPDYDLIITSFGITAYESIAAGVPVALLNPTEYHQKLSIKAGFYSIDDKVSINYKKAINRLAKINLGKCDNLTSYIYNLNLSNMGCPVCGRRSNQAVDRFDKKSYYICSHCSVEYMLSHEKKIQYSNDYFFKDYKEQYGKTYLEDFDHIKTMGLTRLKHISKRLRKGSTILDIGCAFGPFMAAAQSVGFVPYGIDPSTEGILYIKNKLGLMAAESSFPICEALPFPTPFNGITMWYVIEHFKNLDSVLTQVNVLLPKGGVFAFSTPNISGITGLKSKRAFRHNSPQDHFTLFDPKSAKKVLKEYGFKVYKVNVTGHHPKRFGGWVRGSFLSKIIYHISRLFRLGDTFEIYSIKENNL